MLLRRSSRDGMRIFRVASLYIHTISVSREFTPELHKQLCCGSSKFAAGRVFWQIFNLAHRLFAQKLDIFDFNLL